jgi:hypothetical protein
MLKLPLKMKFSIFVTLHIRMGWIKSSYEDKYLIFKKKIINLFFLNYKFIFCPKIKTIHVGHYIFLTMS